MPFFLGELELFFSPSEEFLVLLLDVSFEDFVNQIWILVTDAVDRALDLCAHALFAYQFRFRDIDIFDRSDDFRKLIQFKQSVKLKKYSK